MSLKNQFLHNAVPMVRCSINARSKISAAVCSRARALKCIPFSNHGQERQSVGAVDVVVVVADVDVVVIVVVVVVIVVVVIVVAVAVGPQVPG